MTQQNWTDAQMWSLQQRRRALHTKLLVVAMIATMLAVAFGIAAWQKRETFVPSVATAHHATTAGDHHGALLHLKSLVQQQPHNGELRYELGHAHLAAGNATAALKEFGVAARLGFHSEAYAQDFVEALIINGEFTRAGAKLSKHAHADSARWNNLQGLLDLGAGRVKAAKAGFERALQQADANGASNAVALRGRAQAELSLGNLSAARVAIEAVLASNHNDRQAAMLKGALELTAGRYADAQAVYQSIVDHDPRDYDAQLGLLRALIGTRVWPKVHALSARLPARADHDPAALHLKAIAAAEQNHTETALKFATKALQYAPRHRPSLALLATLYFQSGDYARAQEYAQRLQHIAPADRRVARLRGAIDLVGGDLQRGLQAFALDAHNIEAQNNVELLTLVGAAYAKHGDFELSTRSLARAHQLAPDSPFPRVQMVLTKIAANERHQARTRLDELIAEQPDFVLAPAIRIMLAVMEGELERAAHRAEQLSKQHPQLALAHNVQGLVHEAREQFEPAKHAFQRALDRDYDFHAARINLARIALRHQDTDAAAAHYRDIIEHQAHHLHALLGLARLALQTRDLNAAQSLLASARDHHPERPEPLLALAGLRTVVGDAAAALTAAQDAYALAPNNDSVQVALIKAALRAGNAAAGHTALAALKKRRPHALEVAKLEIELLASSGHREDLMRRAEELLVQAPDDIGVNHTVARLALAHHDTERTRVVAQRLINDLGAPALGYELAGDAHFGDQRFDAAASAYATSLSARASARTLLKLVHAEKRTGVAPAHRLSEWLQTHPNDLVIRQHYANALHAAGEDAAAAQQYEHITSSAPNDVVALNNLAWIYADLNDPRAIATAQRAVERAPQQAAIIDTYGWLLLQVGRVEQAVDFLQKAADAAPDNADIHYHLAAAYAKSGQHHAARGMLAEILGRETDFDSRRDAAALQATLAP